MNRRNAVSKLLGKAQNKKTVAKTMITNTVSLTPYAGVWEWTQAAHLLRRTTFGASYDLIQTAVNQGMEATINQLLATAPLPSPPINYYYENDPNVPLGEPWLTAPYAFEHRFVRMKSLEGWTVKLILEEGISLREKMTLFWHNHFVTAEFPTWSRFRYQYISKLRANAFGNFKELTKQMTVDPSMLRYLNGHSNTKLAPNENYARELLELFTIGKGELIAAGDYSNYTEADIAAIARVLTGWRYTDNNTNGEVIQNQFMPNLHDEGDKQLSHHFGNAIIFNNGADEYIDLINLIFQQNEVAKFLCRKLYRWFVHYDIDDTIEATIIAPLAQILIDNDYEIAPVLAMLFSSEHFYEVTRIGCMIKNPWDFVMGVKQFEIAYPQDPAVYYESYRVIFQAIVGLQMEYFNPPNVAGWTPYYQSPSYYRLWLNTATLSARSYGITLIGTLGFPLFVDPGVQTGFAPIDYLHTLDNLSDPYDVNVVINDFVKLFFAKDIADNQKAFLKDILLSGLPDFEWTDEYSNYINNPANTSLAASIRNKLRNLYVTMLNMPEYQLM